MGATKKSDTSKKTGTAKKAAAAAKIEKSSEIKKTDEAYIFEDPRFDNYVQRKMPDKEQLAQLIIEARGEDRTMAQFAEECGKSPSAFSRLVNSNYTMVRALSPYVISAIAQYSASTKVTYDALMHANGYITKDEDNRMETDIRSANSPGYFEFKEKIKKCIVMNLLEKGKTIKQLSRENYEFPKSSYRLWYQSALLYLEIDGEEKTCVRYFAAIDLTSDENGTLKVIGVNPGKETDMAANVFRDHADIFLMDAWEPEALADVKTVFVFGKEAVFNEFVRLASEVKINSRMSAMLVDVQEEKVVEEREITK